MGTNQNRGNILVVMTNKDVYYVSPKAAEELETAMNAEQIIFETVDIRSHLDLKIQVRNVSAIVVQEGAYRG